MRLVFAGTPATAVPSLEALLAAGFDVAAVLTRPPAASGRGRHVQPSAVAEVAQQHGIEVLSPARLSDAAFRARFAELAPDVVPVVAYGALVPADLLDVPPLGWVNLHFSLLPAWRGAAPVQWALLHGDDITGATTFRLDVGLDTGPVYGHVTESVRPTDTSGDLLERLSHSGAELLVATVGRLAKGTLRAAAQPLDGVSHAPKLEPADARVRWTDPYVGVDRRIRATTPEPGAWTTFRDERLGIGPVRLAPADGPARATPGELVVSKHEVRVGTASGDVVLGEVRPAGKRPMQAADWARGVRPRPGERFE